MPDQPESLQPTLKKKCPDCPPLVVPRRGYTPTHPSCVECVEKHVRATHVLLTELNDLPDAHRTEPGNLSRPLRAIGHLFEAQDESQQWPDLHTAIREARRAYQATGAVPDWESLARRAHDQRVALADEPASAIPVA